MSCSSDKKAENLRLLIEDARDGRDVYRALPDVVSFYTTDVCNLRCIMCVRHDEPGVHRLDRATLARVCDALFPTARRALVQSDAGEPLLSDFDVILDAALRDGVLLDVITNGLPLTVELYRRMRDALNQVNVSVDCHVPAIYERIREGARFSRLRANLEAIAQERRRVPDGVTLTMSAVVMRSNLPHLAGFVRFAREMGMHAVVFQPLRQYAKRTAEEDPLDDAEPEFHSGSAGGCPHPGHRVSERWRRIFSAFDEARVAAVDVGINVYFNDFCLPGTEVAPLTRRIGNGDDESRLCWSVANNFALYWTGDVYPCCNPTDHRLGNIFRQSIAEIWNGPEARRLRRAHFSRRGTLFCSGCVHAPYLPARSTSAWPDAARKSRLAWNHVSGRLAHSWRSLNAPAPPRA